MKKSSEHSSFTQYFLIWFKNIVVFIGLWRTNFENLSHKTRKNIKTQCLYQKNALFYLKSVNFTSKVSLFLYLRKCRVSNKLKTMSEVKVKSENFRRNFGECRVKLTLTHSSLTYFHNFCLYVFKFQNIAVNFRPKFCQTKTTTKSSMTINAYLNM